MVSSGEDIIGGMVRHPSGRFHGEKCCRIGKATPGRIVFFPVIFKREMHGTNIISIAEIMLSKII